MQDIYSSSQTRLNSFETSKVLRSTYALLGATLLFSAICAGIAMMVGMPRGGAMVCSFGAIALIWFVLPRTANSSSGIWVVFAFTGLLGAGLGPILNYYLKTQAGTAIVTQSLGGTALIFFGLSAYTMISRKDFSFMGGFIFTGLMVAFFGSIASLFFHIPMLQVIISSAFLFLSSLAIMYETSRIIHGGQTNYILATASLYVSIYNIFVSLLTILGALSGDD